MKTYLASCYADSARMRAVVDYILRPLGIVCVSRWIFQDEPNSGMTADHGQQDIEDLFSADLLVFFNDDVANSLPSGGGRHVEFGMAIVAAMPVILVGKASNPFHLLRNVVIVPSVPELHLELMTRVGLERAGGMAEGRAVNARFSTVKDGRHM